MLDRITDEIALLTAAVNIGVIQLKEKTYLVDTGIDNTAINKALKQLGTTVDGAFISHHHADHMGGIAKLESLGVKEFYGPPDELELFMRPSLEPFTMFGGSLPPKIMRNRHLEAKPASALHPATSDILVPVATPGHSPAHQVYLRDGILFSGDAAFTDETISKYKLLYAVDPHAAAESLKVIEHLKFDILLPGHGPIQHSRQDAMAVIAATRDHYLDTSELVLATVGEGLDYHELVPNVLATLRLSAIVKERGVTQYFLYQVPIQGYLSNLLDIHKLELSTDSGILRIIPSNP